MDFNLNAGFFARNEKRVYAVNDLSFTLEKGKKDEKEKEIMAI